INRVFKKNGLKVGVRGRREETIENRYYNYIIKLVRQEAMLCIANELPLPFGVILPGCAFVVMQRCKAPRTMWLFLTYAPKKQLYQIKPFLGLHLCHPESCPLPPIKGQNSSIFACFYINSIAFCPNRYKVGQK